MSIPTPDLSKVLPVTCIDHLSICLSPPVDGAGIRSIEGRIELLLLPTQSVDRSAKILNSVHKGVSAHVHQHIAQLMEELSDQHASALRAAEQEIRSRELHLKNLRDDVERERKQQEVMLRDMRTHAIAAHEEAEDRKAARGNKQKSQSRR